MPLLGLGKKQEQAGTGQAAKEDIPDELPDLPQDSGQQDSSEEGAVPDELPPVDSLGPDDLAPDELPPMGEHQMASGAGATDDQRLYFSSLLQKIHEDGLKSTKLTTPTANLLSDMKKHWKDQKKAQELDAQLKEVTESISPLQRLEQEWVTLQEEIDQRKALLREKEAEIQKLAEQAKVAAMKAERMKKAVK